MWFLRDTLIFLQLFDMQPHCNTEAQVTLTHHLLTFFNERTKIFSCKYTLTISSMKQMWETGSLFLANIFCRCWTYKGEERENVSNWDFQMKQVERVGTKKSKGREMTFCQKLSIHDNQLNVVILKLKGFKKPAPGHTTWNAQELIHN